MMVGAPHNALRRQLDAINLMSPPHNYSSRNAGIRLKVPHRTIRRWKHHYDLFGEVPAATWNRNRKRGILRRKYNRLVTPAVRNCLRNLILETPQLYLDEFCDKIFQRTGLFFHTSTVYRLLKSLGWSLKKMFAMAGERNEIQRAEHHVLLNQLTNNPAQFVFVDETAKDRNSSLRQRAWQLKGLNRAINRNFLDWRDYRYTLIAAVDIDGFIPEACEMVRRKINHADADPDTGTIDAQRFEHWIQYFLVPTLGNYYLGEKRSIVVMDNASTHMSVNVFNLITATGAILVYHLT
mmetsp:Transcript_17138/g.24802  ORF Transcript_17138/g.24802 Transcript_17138/m.24802 type:complete len:294 (+) Transcript_17138:43-924(+)